ncbi:hypothetical protein [Mycoplasmopsis columbinasalis]|uniref:Uncharacterized protein n=1 Tax=Mycoplasmopsis columbinasalis TaxID=114880 RepID=A0A449BAI0_9BACT|nr:hypothetical protein [Mycoplasmopsis columbinasalis]VEU78196.1 Uncharacterised protein [Mycoplasmopsis columbinasalis]
METLEAAYNEYQFLKAQVARQQSTSGLFSIISTLYIIGKKVSAILSTRTVTGNSGLPLTGVYLIKGIGTSAQDDQEWAVADSTNEYLFDLLAQVEKFDENTPLTDEAIATATTDSPIIRFAFSTTEFIRLITQPDSFIQGDVFSPWKSAWMPLPGESFRRLASNDYFEYFTKTIDPVFGKDGSEYQNFKAVNDVIDILNTTITNNNVLFTNLVNNEEAKIAFQNFVKSFKTAQEAQKLIDQASANIEAWLPLGFIETRPAINESGLATEIFNATAAMVNETRSNPTVNKIFEFKTQYDALLTDQKHLDVENVKIEIDQKLDLWKQDIEFVNQQLSNLNNLQKSKTFLQQILVNFEKVKTASDEDAFPYGAVGIKTFLKWFIDGSSNVLKQNNFDKFRQSGLKYFDLKDSQGNHLINLGDTFDQTKINQFAQTLITQYSDLFDLPNEDSYEHFAYSYFGFADAYNLSDAGKTKISAKIAELDDKIANIFAPLTNFFAKKQEIIDAYKNAESKIDLYLTELKQIYNQTLELLRQDPNLSDIENANISNFLSALSDQLVKVENATNKLADNKQKLLNWDLDINSLKTKWNNKLNESNNDIGTYVKYIDTLTQLFGELSLLQFNEDGELDLRITNPLSLSFNISRTLFGVIAPLVYPLFATQATDSFANVNLIINQAKKLSEIIQNSKNTAEVDSAKTTLQTLFDQNKETLFQHFFFKSTLENDFFINSLANANDALHSRALIYPDLEGPTNNVVSNLASTALGYLQKFEDTFNSNELSKPSPWSKYKDELAQTPVEIQKTIDDIFGYTTSYEDLLNTTLDTRLNRESSTKSLYQILRDKIIDETKDAKMLRKEGNIINFDNPDKFFFAKSPLILINKLQNAGIATEDNKEEILAKIKEVNVVKFAKEGQKLTVFLREISKDETLNFVNQGYTDGYKIVEFDANVKADIALKIDEFFKELGYERIINPYVIQETGFTFNQKGEREKLYSVYLEAYPGLLNKIKEQFPYAAEWQNGPHLVKTLNADGVYRYEIQEGSYLGWTANSRIGLWSVLKVSDPSFKGLSADFLTFVSAHEYGHHITLNGAQDLGNKGTKPLLVSALMPGSQPQLTAYNNADNLRLYLQARSNLDFDNNILLDFNKENQGYDSAYGEYPKWKLPRRNENGELEFVYEDPRDVFGTEDGVYDIQAAFSNKKRRFGQHYDSFLAAVEARRQENNLTGDDAKYLRISDLWLLNTLDPNSATLNPSKFKGLIKILQKKENGEEVFEIASVENKNLNLTDKAGNPITFSYTPTGDLVPNVVEGEYVNGADIKFQDVYENTGYIKRKKFTKVLIKNADGTDAVKLPLNVELTDLKDIEYYNNLVNQLVASIQAFVPSEVSTYGWDRNHSSAKVDVTKELNILQDFPFGEWIDFHFDDKLVPAHYAMSWKAYFNYVLNRTRTGFRDYFKASSNEWSTLAAASGGSYNIDADGNIVDDKGEINGPKNPLFMNNARSYWVANSYQASFDSTNLSNDYSTLQKLFSAFALALDTSKGEGLRIGAAPALPEEVVESLGDPEQILMYQDGSQALALWNSKLGRTRDEHIVITNTLNSNNLSENVLQRLHQVLTRADYEINYAMTEEVSSPRILGLKNVISPLQSIMTAFGGVSTKPQVFFALDNEGNNYKLDLNNPSLLGGATTAKVNLAALTENYELSLFEAFGVNGKYGAELEFSKTDAFLSFVKVDLSKTKLNEEKRRIDWDVAYVNTKWNRDLFFKGIKFWVESGDISPEKRTQMQAILDAQDETEQTQLLANEFMYRFLRSPLALVHTAYTMQQLREPAFQHIQWIFDKNFGLDDYKLDFDIFATQNKETPITWSDELLAHYKQLMHSLNYEGDEPYNKEYLKDWIDGLIPRNITFLDVLINNSNKTIVAPMIRWNFWKWEKNHRSFATQLPLLWYAEAYFSQLSGFVRDKPDPFIESLYYSKTYREFNQLFSDYAWNWAETINRDNLQITYSPVTKNFTHLPTAIGTASESLLGSTYVINGEKAAVWKEKFVELERSYTTKNIMDTLINYTKAYEDENKVYSYNYSKYTDTVMFSQASDFMPARLSSSYFGQIKTDNNAWYKDRWYREITDFLLYDDQGQPVEDHTIRIKDLKGEKVTNLVTAYWQYYLQAQGIGRRNLTKIWRNLDLDAVAMFGYVPNDMKDKIKYLAFKDLKTGEVKTLPVTTENTDNLFYYKTQKANNELDSAARHRLADEEYAYTDLNGKHKGTGFTAWVSNYAVMSNYKDRLLNPGSTYYLYFASDAQGTFAYEVDLGDVESVSENGKTFDQAPVKVTKAQDNLYGENYNGKSILIVQKQFNAS